MPLVIHFEIHADDPERAVTFYKGVFGWDIQRWDGPAEYWLIKTGPDEQPGINGGLMARHGPIDGNSVIAYVGVIDVPAIDEYMRRISGHGGTQVVPKMPIPGIGWLAYCKDTEGNVFGIMQNDAQAK